MCARLAVSSSQARGASIKSEVPCTHYSSLVDLVVELDNLWGVPTEEGVDPEVAMMPMGKKKSRNC